jgi:hypothetical protein
MATLLRVTVRESDAALLQARDNRRSRIFGFMGWGAAVVVVLLVALAVRELVHDDYACHCPEYYQAVATTFDWSPATYSGALVRYETRSEIDANIATASIQLTATDPDLAAARIEERLLQLGFVALRKPGATVSQWRARTDSHRWYVSGLGPRPSRVRVSHGVDLRTSRSSTVRSSLLLLATGGRSTLRSLAEIGRSLPDARAVGVLAHGSSR